MEGDRVMTASSSTSGGRVGAIVPIPNGCDQPTAYDIPQDVANYRARSPENRGQGQRQGIP